MSAWTGAIWTGSILLIWLSLAPLAALGQAAAVGKETGLPIPRYVSIRADEAKRLRERFITRARAVFYARIAFLVLWMGVFFIPQWRQTLGADGSYAIPWFIFTVVAPSASASI